MNHNCAIYNSINFLGKKWTFLIILELYKGKDKQKRYSEIKNKLSEITPKILSQRLKELEHHRILTKTTDSSKFPIKTKYTLTKIGLEIIPIIKSIKSWTLKHNPKNKYCSETDCEHCEF